MAIDTEDKRRSVSGYGGAKVAPLADGSVDDADRYQVGWIYAGTSPQGAPTGRIMCSMVGPGGLVSLGGIAGRGGGLAG